MSALRYIGALLLIVCGALAGLYLASRAKKKLTLFEEYESFLIGCISMITLCGSDAQAVGDYCSGFPSLAQAGRAFSSAALSGRDPCTGWNDAVTKLTADYGLSSEEEKFLICFAENYGEGDCDSEAARIALIRERTALLLEAMRKETAEKTRLYRVVGTFAGALCAAILI